MVCFTDMWYHTFNSLLCDSSKDTFLITWTVRCHEPRCLWVTKLRCLALALMAEIWWLLDAQVGLLATVIIWYSPVVPSMFLAILLMRSSKFFQLHNQLFYCIPSLNNAHHLTSQPDFKCFLAQLIAENPKNCKKKFHGHVLYENTCIVWKHLVYVFMVMCITKSKLFKTTCLEAWLWDAPIKEAALPNLKQCVTLQSSK